MSKTQLLKIIQSGGFLSRLLGPLLKTRLPLLKNVIKPFFNSKLNHVLIPLGLTAAASAADWEYIEKILGPGHNRPSSSALHNATTQRMSNNQMEDIIKIVKSLEDSGLLSKEVTETVQNEVKEQKGGFLSMLLGTLDANLLGNLLTGKGATATSQGRGIYREGKVKE